MHSYDYKKAIITTTTDYKDNINYFGLVKQHAYTLIGTAFYKDPQGKTHRLVKIRNPWGKEVYNGPWSDNSAEMTANNGDALTKLKHNSNTRDGIFYQDIATFRSTMYVSTIINYDPNYKRSQRMAAFDRDKGFTQDHKDKGFTKDLMWTFNNPVA